MSDKVYSPKGNYCSECKVFDSWCEHIQPPESPATLFGMPLVTSDAIAPGTLVMHGVRNSVRVTVDGVVEELTEEQRRAIVAIIEQSSGSEPTA